MGLSIVWVSSAPVGETDVGMVAAYPEFAPQITLPGRVTETSFAYGEFSLFREVCTAVFGVYLRDLKGYGGATPSDAAACADLEVRDLWVALLPLINHSDVSGTLSSTECAGLIAPLRHIAAQVSDTAQHDRVSANVDMRLSLDMWAGIAASALTMSALCELASLDGYLSFG